MNPTPLVSEPNTPPYINRMNAKINAAFLALAIPTASSYASPSALPAANLGNAGTIVLINSISRLAFSNGTNWLRSDTGAVIA